MGFLIITRVQQLSYLCRMTGRALNTKKRPFGRPPIKQFAREFRQICGHHYVIFRSRKTGEYAYDAGDAARLFRGRIEPVSYDQNFDRNEVVEDLPSASDFLSALPIKHECVILTMVPAVNTQSAFTNDLAKELGMSVVAPRLDGLQTFDGSHLDRESAERWSKAFFQAAGAQI